MLLAQRDHASLNLAQVLMGHVYRLGQALQRHATMLSPGSQVMRCFKRR
jgi:hypothetical protein